jgi:pimeloyl-ACP methyl ester carboxylesterase
VRANDVIVEVNDHPIIDVADFVRTAKALRAGTVATLRILRQGEALTRSVQVKPRPYESAPDVDTSYRSVAGDGSLRRLLVTCPKTPGRHPAVLHPGGIGCLSQESQGPACASPAADFEAERRGYAAGLKALKQYPFVDGGNTFLVGLSVGGVLAPLVAQDEPVKGIVVINTVVRPVRPSQLRRMRANVLDESRVRSGMQRRRLFRRVRERVRR